MKKTVIAKILAGAIALLLLNHAQAAISLDRTRVVFPGTEKSVSLKVTNQNSSLPYLAQGWIEDADGKKLEGEGPFALLPPVQRIEPDGKSQVKIQPMQSLNQLPQDKETLFYLNMREIPPKSDKPNTLQIALQTRIKLFYRPAAIVAEASGRNAQPFQEKLTLSKSGDAYTVNNPTPFYVTIVSAGPGKSAEAIKGFETLMVPPRSSAPLGAKASALGKNPVLVYINDYGGRPELTFSCDAANCKVNNGQRDAT